MNVQSEQRWCPSPEDGSETRATSMQVRVGPDVRRVQGLLALRGCRAESAGTEPSACTHAAPQRAVHSASCSST